MRGSKKRGTSGDLFDKRTQQVLQGIIDNFISTSEPVGSRTLSKTLGLSLSPATIRNIMSDLSDQGYLTQVHTSGGRIPTDKAYRFFVDSLVVADKLPEQLQKNIEEISYQGASAVQDLLINTSHLLAGLTKFASLVTAPKTSLSRLQHIEFIKISGDRILVILVTKSGLIKNRVVECQDQLSQEFLNSVSGFLNEKFKDHSLLEIRKQILDSMVEDKDRYNELLAQAIRLGKKAFELDQPVELFIEGQTNLLMNQRLHEEESKNSLIRAFEQKSAIMEILDQTMENHGTRIFIGLENELSGLQECSLITACYGNKHNMLGTIGVIGPISMDYRRIIPVVDYTAKIVSQTIASQSYD